MFKLFVNDQGIECIEITPQGLDIAFPKHILDWTPRSGLRGISSTKMRRVKLEDIHDDYARQGWLPEADVHGLLEEYCESYGSDQWQWHYSSVSTNRSYVFIVLSG